MVLLTHLDHEHKHLICYLLLYMLYVRIPKTCQPSPKIMCVSVHKVGSKYLLTATQIKSLKKTLLVLFSAKKQLLKTKSACLSCIDVMIKRISAAKHSSFICLPGSSCECHSSVCCVDFEAINPELRARVRCEPSRAGQAGLALLHHAAQFTHTKR